MVKLLSFVSLFALVLSFSPHAIHAMEGSDHEHARRIRRQGDDLFFIAEEVNETSRAAWRAYAKEGAREASRKIREEREQKKQHQQSHNEDISKETKDVENFFVGMSDGLINFEQILGKYYNPDPKNITWIVYAYSSKEQPSDFYTKDFFSHVEMAYGIVTTEDAPFSSHMGISRSFTYHMASEQEKNAKPLADQDVIFNYPQHKQISIPLHEFGAFHTRSIYPNKRYMITSPLPTMGGLILNALPRGSAWLGDEEWIKTQYHNKEAMIAVGHDHELSTVKEYIDSQYPQAADIIEHNKSWSPVKVCDGEEEAYNLSIYRTECDCDKLNCQHMEPNPEFEWVLRDTNKEIILTLTSKEIESGYRWFFHPMYLTDLFKFPYVIADLRVLGAALPVAK